MRCTHISIRHISTRYGSVLALTPSYRSVSERDCIPSRRLSLPRRIFHPHHRLHPLRGLLGLQPGPLGQEHLLYLLLPVSLGQLQRGQTPVVWEVDVGAPGSRGLIAVRYRHFLEFHFLHRSLAVFVRNKLARRALRTPAFLLSVALSGLEGGRRG